MQIEMVIALLSAIVAIGSFIRAGRMQNAERNKLKAEEAEIITEAAMRLLDPLNARIWALEKSAARAQALILRLENRVSALEKENKMLYNGARRLSNQVIDLGAEPVYTPPYKEE